MGKRNNRRGGNKKFGKRPDNRTSWVEIPKENAKWETYYKAQNLIPEEEWDTFMKTCQKQLPLTFRITGSRKHAKEILQVFKDKHLPALLKVDINEIKRQQQEKAAIAAEKVKAEQEALKAAENGGAVAEASDEASAKAEAKAEKEAHAAEAARAARVVAEKDEEIEEPTSLPWYPNELAWQVNVPKTIMKKHPAYQTTQRFLVVETEVGNISRQEAVSMIPPLVLDVKPEHYVLDMCAAPGSKTAQLVEALHDIDNSENVENVIPKGFVMANDSDYKRSYMLVHQVKRLNSPNFIVINHDGQMLPKFKLNNSNQFVKFDRILCDVPCTGDGTMRKNVTVWKEWSIGNALGMHSLQLNILNRGLQLLKPGGRLVYSTCSLSPIENEAVVAAALRKWGAEVRTVNCDDRLPGLIRREGVSNWKVFNKEGTELANVEELEAKRSEEVNKKIQTSVFPPTEEEAKSFHLENCIRVYPHLQNTGGFFITVLEKVDTSAPVTNDKKRSAEEEEAEAAKKTKTDAAAPSDEASAAQQQQQNNNNKNDNFKLVPLKREKLPRDANEEPFVFLESNNEKLQKCWDFYEINDSFPKDSTLVRNASGEPLRSIYFVAPVIKQIITHNELKLKFVHSGLKLFVSQKKDKEEDIAWRLQSESLAILKGFLSNKRQITIKEVDVLKVLLEESFPKMDKLKELSQSFYDQIEQIKDEGCCFLSIDRNDDNKEELFLPIWRGKNNVNLMVNKHDTFELLYRIFGIETTRTSAYKQDVNKDEKKDEEKKEEIKEEVSAPAQEAATPAAPEVSEATK